MSKLTSTLTSREPGPGSRLNERPREHPRLNNRLKEEIAERRRAEEELRASEETLRVISDTALDAVILMDSKGKVGHWNAAAERMFGYTCEEILERDLHKVLAPPHYRDGHEHALPHFFRTGQGAAIGKVLELEGMRKDGSFFPVELSLGTVRLRGEWCAVGILRDITARKRAERDLRSSEARFRRITTSMVDLIVELNEKGRINYVAPSTLRATGYALNEVLGKRGLEFIHAEDRSRAAAVMESVIETHEPVRLELRCVRADESTFWLEVEVNPLRKDDGRLDGFLVAAAMSRSAGQRKRSCSRRRETPRPPAGPRASFWRT